MLKKIVAVILCLILTMGLFSCRQPKAPFDYLLSDLSEYVALSRSDIEGLRMDLGDSYVADTEEEVNRYLEARQWFYATVEEEKVYGQKPGRGDQAYIYYDVSLTEDGEGVLSNLSGEGTKLISVGAEDYPFLMNYVNDPYFFYQKAFTEDLLQSQGTVKLTQRTIAPGDVLRAKYVGKDRDGKVFDQGSSVRYDLAVDNLSFGREFIAGLSGKTPEQAGELSVT
ncbi:MAG: hypothetical protein MJ078_05295, partial [Clostridia bacterium]|nr:hypothetical protein [Clostridia bacterium]